MERKRTVFEQMTFKWRLRKVDYERVFQAKEQCAHSRNVC